MDSIRFGLMLKQGSLFQFIQGSIFEPLFFLKYINDLYDGLTLNPKLFADDTSLFSVVQNTNSTANGSKSDLIKISD